VKGENQSKCRQVGKLSTLLLLLPAIHASFSIFAVIVRQEHFSNHNISPIARNSERLEMLNCFTSIRWLCWENMLDNKCHFMFSRQTEKELNHFILSLIHGVSSVNLTAGKWITADYAIFDGGPKVFP
jgi:hypothetical protein